MTINEVLQAEGLSAEEIQTLTSNPKYAATLQKLRDKAEQGETALLNAKQIEENLKKFNQETVIPYGLKKDQEAAQARAELAKTQAYLKSLKESGYEIPDDYLSAAPPANMTPPQNNIPSGNYAAPEDLEKQGRAYMSLMSMSEKARDLLGHGLDVEAEYDDFGKNKRPGEVLRDYISRKYDLGTKEAERKAAADQKKLDEYAASKLEEWKAKNPISADPERGAPRPTKFDRLANLDTERKQLWQTAEGREKATRDRISKYSMVN